MAWYRRLRNILRRDQVDADIEKEFAFHFGERVDDLIALGMSEEEARRTARRQFGNYTLQKERTRDMDTSFIGDVWRDLRYGVRQLRRSPAFTLVALVALGIGVGANITIFGFVNALVFRPLDAKEPSRLVRVFGEGGNTQTAMATNSTAYIPAQDYFQYRDRNQSFSDLAAQFIGRPSAVRVNGPPQMIPVMPVSGNYFDTIGVPAAMGRTITPQDARRGAPVIVLSDAGWRRFFNADVNVVGKTAVIDGVPKTIVGVTPSWFKGTDSPMIAQIYTPMIESPDPLPFRVWLVGRLKPGVSATQARADLSRIAAQLTTQDQKRRFIEIYPGTVLMPFMLATMSLFASVFAIIVGVVLLIVCDNIAILILTRSAMRRKEIAIRLALGASRSRLITELLVESTLLCAGGGVVGIFSAYTAARFLTQIYLPAPMPFALTFNLDWRVVVFTVGISFAATLLCGLVPALQSLKTDVVTVLRRGAGLAEASRVRSGLIVTQLTLSTTLLVTAVVFAHSLMGSVSQDRGFVSDGVLMSTISIGRQDYTPERRVAFLETLLERIEHAPGVSAVTIVDSIPLTNNNPINPIELQSDGRIHKVYTNRVTRGLFQTLGIPLLAGRDFTAGDNATSLAVGIVNETLANRFWPGDNPIGRNLEGADGSLIEVIGLARDSKYESIDEPRRALLYRPMAQGPVPVPTFLVKAMGDPSTMFSFVRTQVAELDPDLVPYNLITLDDRLGLSLLANRAGATIAGALGILALALGSIGIYGTMSFLAQQRRHEIGVRLALGASPSGVIRLITKQGMIWIATGLTLGLAGGFGSALLLRGLLYGVTANDPIAFILTPLILGGTAYIACYFPASRASRLDPLIILREE